MAEKLNDKEIVSFKEMLIANSIQVDTLSQLLIEKGIISEQEFFTKLKMVHMEYENKKPNTLAKLQKFSSDINKHPS